MNIKIAIVGATGYTGSELFRILHNHPNAELVAITSNSYAGQPFSNIHPQFFGIDAPELTPHEAVENFKPDVVFLALPHGISMQYVEKWHQAPFKIIDLSGDFRLSSPEVYENWYNKQHTFIQGFENSIYGLPEIHKNKIDTATLIANPGCFPTSAILGLAPLLAHHLIEKESIIIDAKTGITGAGAKVRGNTHFPTVNDNFLAYGLKKHRHTIEIEEQCTWLFKDKVQVQFTPHLLPIDRGILSTIYAKPSENIDDETLQKVYKSYYADADFVRVLSYLPALKSVRGSNFCDLHATIDNRTGNIIIFSAIDNLVKGASGAAVQNMNLLFNLSETTGLLHLPLQP